jgi:hypothetical protein
MQDQASSIPFAWAWVAFGLGDARLGDTTYGQYRYADLPPLPPLDGTLSWLGQPGWLKLPDMSPDQQAAHERFTAEAQAHVRNLATQAERWGVRLPATFTHLMAAPELYTRIPEYAGCWFNLWDAQLDPCPGVEDAFVVRFLNDQQDCVLWYLYFSRRGDEAVLAVWDPYPDAPSNYLERLVRPDEDGPLTEQERRAVLSNTYACAPSFEAFVYRWWLETTIYMKLHGYDSESLTEEEHRYLAHYEQGRFAE